MNKNISINLKRLENDMSHINEFNKTKDKGYTRFSYSDEDRKAKQYLHNIFQELKLEVRIDGVGNVRAKYNPNNSNEPSIMIGSHIDTVPRGGGYDGLLGTITALEVIRTIKENDVLINKPIELIVFAEEEGSNFGSGVLGSRALLGNVNKSDLEKLKNDYNESALVVMEKFGLDTSSIGEDYITNKDVDAMIELHIEQGIVLDQKGISVGIVNAIVGLSIFKVIVKGKSNHAGTTPMTVRQDPLIGASKIILFIEATAKNTSATAVSTVGKLRVSPGGSNVINEEVIFNVDIRDIKQESIDKMSESLKKTAKEIEEENNLTIEIIQLQSTQPAKMSEKIISILKKHAENKNISSLIMPSGAGHDAMNMARVVDTGMIFVPSQEGISHNKKEYTAREEIETGANLMLGAVIELAQ